LDDVDAIVVSIMGTVALQLTDLKHDLTKIEKIQPFPTNETSIQTLDRSFGYFYACFFFPRGDPATTKKHGTGLVGKVL